MYSTICVKKECVSSETGTQITWAHIAPSAVGPWNPGLRRSSVFSWFKFSIAQEIESQIFILAHTVTVVTRQD